MTTMAAIQPIRILIVDDIAPERLMLQRSLSASGRFEVVGEAVDGRQAIEVASAEQPDVILLDLAMPVMDGLEALPDIASCSPGSVIIVLSGFDAEPSAGTALQRGAHAYLQKGHAPDQISRRIDEIYHARPAMAEHTVSPETPADGSRAAGNAELARFAAIAAHDLRSPVQVVLGFSELLVSLYGDRLDDEGRHLLNSIVSGARRIEGVIDGLVAGTRVPPAWVGVVPTADPAGEVVARDAVTTDDGPTIGGATREGGESSPDGATAGGRRTREAVLPLRVLLVEDSPEHADLIGALLAQAPDPGYRLQLVGSVKLALGALTTGDVDCVLLDLSLPDARDLEAVAQVRTAAPRLPVVVITSSADEALAFAAVREGAQDYLVKGHIDVEQLSRSIRWAVQRKALANELARNALHDALTQLPNRTLLLDRLRSALGRSQRSGLPVAVFYMDLDNFKPVNDRLGHDAGDQVLTVIADRLKSALRPQDTVARIGGDEFVVLCEGLNGDNGGVEAVRTRLAKAVAEPVTLAGPTVQVTASIGRAPTVGVPGSLEGRRVQVTASIGVSLASGERDPDVVLREADLAMYEVKRARS